ncbi:flagellar motor protein MotB [Flavobacterium sp. 316]|uniref:OmpA family protein n=1 Tax=Flavobacterium sp. 316 TaxID=1603293 RepID=UPI0005E0EE20|nr:OmpA family protein [Flavobacterium sp. 316]KIX22873.1 flagellar motor protein MotB [Flavobacterium sp. 316]
MKKIIQTAIFLFSISLFSQSSLDKATKYYKTMQYKKAVEMYEKAIEDKGANSQETVFRIANSYFYINDYINAKKWFDKVYEAEQGSMAEVNFIKYIESLKSNRDYDTANNLLKEYYKNNPAKLKMLAYQKKELDSLNKKKTLYTITNLSINTPMSDFGAVKYGPNKIIFYSSRDTSKFNNKIYSWNEQPYLNTYIAEKNIGTGNVDNVKLFLNNLNSDYHDATVAFSNDLEKVYFTSNYLKRRKIKTNKSGLSNMEILRGSIVDNKIVDIETLKFNDENYSCAHPSLCDKGKYLFFVSDMPGGYGCTDIYYAEIFEDGSINTPINAGPSVNTAGREMFPYFVNNTLYFSSDGHYGIGGLDIFESKLESKNSFSTPTNLGSPINSNMDDFSFTYYKETGDGYFSSNRTMGKGDDDIYSFVKTKEVIFQNYSGNVLDEATKKPIPYANIKVIDNFGDTVQNVKSDSLGYYNVQLPCNSEHNLNFSKPNYSSKNVQVKTDDGAKDIKNNIVYLNSFESLVVKEDNVEKIKVNPIYFDLDKFAITPQAESELEKVYYVMTEFPKVVIKIESHTDSRGSDSHNLKLSDNRAKATQTYLIARGISPERIESAIGYGETRLKENCPNGVKCTEERHSINRRSDFIIVSK